MPNLINPPPSPALPISEPTYRKSAFDIYTNVLRLFFNRVAGTLRQLLEVDSGGSVLYFPHCQFYSTVVQSVTLANTPTLVEFDTVGFSENILLEESTKIKVKKAGAYNLVFRVNLTAPSPSSMFVWYRVNGADLENSLTESRVESDSHKVYQTSVVLDPDDYVEVVWSETGTGLALEFAAASSPYPAKLSAIVEVTFAGNAK